MFRQLTSLSQKEYQAEGVATRFKRFLLGLNCVLLLGNVSVPLAFFYFRWAPHIFDSLYRQEKLLVCVYLSLIGCGFVCNYLFCRVRLQIFLINVNHGIIVLILLGAEILYSTFPSYLPSQLVNFEPQLNPALKQHREDVLEYLPESPWVKFKPGVKVRSIGNRGDDFTYSWETDRFGFKNSNSLAARSKFVAIAIGDSFVEASGVATDQTWTAILSNEGYAVYNLGVQGAAPQQMSGYLEKYGKGYKTCFVFWGYTPGFEVRTVSFVDPERALQEHYHGKLGPVSNYMREKRPAAMQYFKVMNAVVDLSKSQVLSFLRARKGHCRSRSSGSIFSRYCDEVESAEGIKFDSSREEWNLMIQSLLQAKADAVQMGAKFAVLIFPSRPLVYYEKVMRQDPPEDFFELQAAKYLKYYAESNDIAIIDLYPSFKSYMNKLIEQQEASMLPYFKVDGHMNAIGQRLIAEVISDYFRSNQDRCISINEM